MILKGLLTKWPNQDESKPIHKVLSPITLIHKIMKATFPAQKATINSIEVEFPAYTVTHISGPKFGKNEGDDWKDGADEFRFEINGQAFEYWTGVGHRQLTKFGKSDLERQGLTIHSWSKVNDRGFSALLNATVPVLPEFEAFLESIILDGSACDQSFEDWASDYGYDTDSRKALATYMACQENYNKLRKAWRFDTEKVREYFEAKNS